MSILHERCHVVTVEDVHFVGFAFNLMCPMVYGSALLGSSCHGGALSHSMVFTGTRDINLGAANSGDVLHVTLDARHTHDI